MSQVSRNIRVFQSSNQGYIILEYTNKGQCLLFQRSFVLPLGKKEKEELMKQCTKLHDIYGCLGVLSLKKDENLLVCVTQCQNVGRLFDNEIYQIKDIAFVSINNETSSQSTSTSPSEIKRLLVSGSFYFTSMTSQSEGTSERFYLTRSLQLQNDVTCNQFCWNRQLLKYLESRGLSPFNWCLDLMCGGINIKTMYLGAHQARIAVISRLSCNRAGTRYNTRGSDDDGYVANFVESEQIVVVKEKCCSFIQIRGSVPLLWEQPGLNVGSHKVKISVDQKVSQKVFDQHSSSLIERYKHFAIINLLGCKEGEASLTKAFQAHHEASEFADQIPFINFDFHTEIRSKKNPSYERIMNLLKPSLDLHGVFVANEDSVQKQQGVLRVNCLDCLDRTNSLQAYLGIHRFSYQLEVMGYSEAADQLQSRFGEILRQNWQKTGDFISRMYAGTGALEGKDDKVGRLRDGARSMSRAIQNNFLDQGKQEAIFRLLQLQLYDDVTNGDDVIIHLTRDLITTQQYLNSSSQILEQIRRRHSEFITHQRIRVAIGTWNVNGGKQLRSVACKDQTLKDWLFPTAEKKFCIATFDFPSDEDGDLELFIGDVIEVLETLAGDEWVRGKKVSSLEHPSATFKQGIFPISYIEMLNDGYRVEHQFDSQHPDDLQLYEGEVVDVVDTKEEWFEGKVWRNEEFHQGLFPANHVRSMNPSADIFALGFEEMVELNAGNIVNTSSTNQTKWGNELLKTIESTSNQSYVLLGSEQLVGICLFVFVKHSLVNDIRELSIATIKTGLGGTTGNKGAVAISLLLRHSSICFVCSHLAAGQSQIQERNSDYQDIYNNLVFHKGRRLSQHDYIFWCGDFNYRIDLPNSEAKQLIIDQNWDKLKEHDQFIEQKKLGNCFKGFREGNIEFAPTYKYDLFSDDYDTSEKCRCPAWTDRVVWKKSTFLQSAREEPAELELVEIEADGGNSAAEIVCYTRAELKTSDHRPVMAVLDVNIKSLESWDERERVFDEIRHQVEPSHQPLFLYCDDENTTLRDISFYQNFILQHDIGRPSLAKSFKHGVLIAFDDQIYHETLLQLDKTMFCNDLIRVTSYTDLLTDDWPEIVVTEAEPPIAQQVAAILEQTSEPTSAVPARPPLPPPPTTNLRPGPPPEQLPPLMTSSPEPSHLPPSPPEQQPQQQPPQQQVFPDIPDNFGLGEQPAVAPMRPPPPPQIRPRKDAPPSGGFNNDSFTLDMMTSAQQQQGPTAAARRKKLPKRQAPAPPPGGAPPPPNTPSGGPTTGGGRKPNRSAPPPPQPQQRTKQPTTISPSSSIVAALKLPPPPTSTRPRQNIKPTPQATTNPQASNPQPTNPQPTSNLLDAFLSSDSFNTPVMMPVPLIPSAVTALQGPFSAPTTVQDPFSSSVPLSTVPTSDPFMSSQPLAASKADPFMSSQPKADPFMSSSQPATSVKDPFMASSQRQPFSSGVQDPFMASSQPVKALKDPFMASSQPATAVKDPFMASSQAVKDPFMASSQPATAVKDPFMASSQRQPFSTGVQDPFMASSQPAMTVKYPFMASSQPATGLKDPFMALSQPATGVKDPFMTPQQRQPFSTGVKDPFMATASQSTTDPFMAPQQQRPFVPGDPFMTQQQRSTVQDPFMAPTFAPLQPMASSQQRRPSLDQRRPSQHQQRRPSQDLTQVKPSFSSNFTDFKFP